MSTPASDIVVHERGPGLLVRALYFVLFGLWFSAIWAAVAWVLCVTLIGLPLGLWMLNRLPQVTTLYPSRADFRITHDGRVFDVHVDQHPWVLRALYFLMIGWWLSALWLVVAWALCSTWIGLPIGFWMFNRVPALITLQRG